MKHVFDVEVARKYDIVVATFLENLSFWIRTNAANGVNLYDGRYWVYSSREAFVKYHPYLNSTQIKHVIKKCLDLELIIKGNYNKKGYDQTSWYTLSDKALIELNLDKTCLKPAETLIGQNCPMDWIKLSNGLDKIVQPIQDINKYINKDNINTPISPAEELTPTRSRSLPQGAVEGEYISAKLNNKKTALTLEDLVDNNLLGIPLHMLRDFVENRKKFPLTETAWININKELLKFQEAGLDPIEQFSEMVTNNWRAISFKKYQQFNTNSRNTTQLKSTDWNKS